MRRRRILRAYTFGADAKLLNDPMVSSAMLPMCRLMGMKRPAEALVNASARALKRSCLDVLIWHRARKFDYVHAVSLIGCPAGAEAAEYSSTPVSLTSRNAYTGSFAALGPHNEIWCGTGMRGRLSDLVRYFTECVRYVQQPASAGGADRRPGMFTPAAMP